jgi:hypothetical protein
MLSIIVILFTIIADQLLKAKNCTLHFLCSICRRQPLNSGLRHAGAAPVPRPLHLGGTLPIRLLAIKGKPLARCCAPLTTRRALVEHGHDGRRADGTGLKSCHSRERSPCGLAVWCMLAASTARVACVHGHCTSAGVRSCPPSTKQFPPPSPTSPLGSPDDGRRRCYALGLPAPTFSFS